MMKKILILALTLILGLALAACGGNTDSGTSQQEPSIASDEDDGSTPDNSGDLQTSAVTVNMPENLKLTYSVGDAYTRTVIKIGDDYYSCYKQYGTDLIDSNSYFFKANSDGTWTQYTYNSGWVTGSTAWSDPVEEFGGLKSSNFYWHILLEADYINQYGNPEETSVVLSRPVKVYKGYGDSSYCVDDETGLVIKGTDGTTEWEVTEWDASVTDFGDTKIPE